MYLFESYGRSENSKASTQPRAVEPWRIASTIGFSNGRMYRLPGRVGLPCTSQRYELAAAWLTAGSKLASQGSPAGLGQTCPAFAGPSATPHARVTSHEKHLGLGGLRLVHCRLSRKLRLQMPCACIHCWELFHCTACLGRGSPQRKGLRRLLLQLRKPRSLGASRP